MHAWHADLYMTCESHSQDTTKTVMGFDMCFQTKAYLQNVVLSNRGDYPILAWVDVPGKVRDLAGVASMDEEQLRRPIFSIFRGLQFSKLAFDIFTGVMSTKEGRGGGGGRGQAAFTDMRCMCSRSACDAAMIGSEPVMTTSEVQVCCAPTRPINVHPQVTADAMKQCLLTK